MVGHGAPNQENMGSKMAQRCPRKVPNRVDQMGHDLSDEVPGGATNGGGHTGLTKWGTS